MLWRPYLRKAHRQTSRSLLRAAVLFVRFRCTRVAVIMEMERGAIRRAILLMRYSDHRVSSVDQIEAHRAYVARPVPAPTHRPHDMHPLRLQNCSSLLFEI